MSSSSCGEDLFKGEHKSMSHIIVIQVMTVSSNLAECENTEHFR